MDGRATPSWTEAEQMSVQASDGDRRHAEALTPGQASSAARLSESLKILGNFKLNGHRPDLFDIFVRNKIYLRYAEQFLIPDQIDEVDESQIPGFAA
jgi:hypothetical protein